MKNIQTVALLAIVLALSLQGCTDEVAQENSPTTSTAPGALQTARFVLDEVP